MQGLKIRASGVGYRIRREDLDFVKWMRKKGVPEHEIMNAVTRRQKIEENLRRG